MKTIDLSEHFTCSKLLLYSLPTIGNALAITSFQLIDGSFIANMLGVTPFAAVNLVSPLFFMFYAIPENPTCTWRMANSARKSRITPR